MHSILLALFTLLPLSFARAGAQADPVIKCASGSALCCGTIGTVSDPSIVKTLNRNGIPIKEATGLLGLDCKFSHSSSRRNMMGMGMESEGELWFANFSGIGVGNPLYTLSGCTDHPLCCDASTDVSFHPSCLFGVWGWGCWLWFFAAEWYLIYQLCDHWPYDHIIKWLTLCGRTGWLLMIIVSAQRVAYM